MPPSRGIALRAHLRRERDPRLRREKIADAKRRGLPIACEVCGFDFGRAYGPHGADFIECHHRTPLHVTGQTQTRKADLALLFHSGAGVPPPEAMMSALTASGGRLCRLGRSAADLGGWLRLKAPLRRVRGLRLGIGDERPTTTLTDVLVIAVRWLLTHEGAPG